MFVPEFRHKDVPLAAAIRGRRPLVFDPLVSRWDTLVEDWRLHRPGSAQARWNRLLDRWSFSAADLVLCDTWAHGELYVTLGARRDRLRRVLVGAEDAFFSVPPAAGRCARADPLRGRLPAASRGRGHSRGRRAASRTTRAVAALRVRAGGRRHRVRRLARTCARSRRRCVHGPHALLRRTIAARAARTSRWVRSARGRRPVA